MQYILKITVANKKNVSYADKIIFTALSDVDAVNSSFRFLNKFIKNGINNYKIHDFAIHSLLIDVIDENGNCKTGCPNLVYSPSDIDSSLSLTKNQLDIVRKIENNIPIDFPVQPLSPDDDCDGRTSCGHCNLSWDDDKSTSYTPVPSGRCPFEYFHE